MPSILDRATACLKGVAIGDAIGKQTETLSREDVTRWYPHGIRGFEGTPGTVIPRYIGNRKHEWRIGETTDVVSKEMYTFEDRGGESITLRPEFTAGICRAYLSEGWQQHAPLKVATHGSAFRYERPQKGRFREFHQLDAEIIGAAEPQADVEILSLGHQLLQELGIGELLGPKLEPGLSGHEQVEDDDAGAKACAQPSERLVTVRHRDHVAPFHLAQHDEQITQLFVVLHEQDWTQTVAVGRHLAPSSRI